MSFELLLAKLTEGAQDYKPKGDLSFDPERLTWEDVSRCLAGVRGGPYYIIRAKWLLDETSKSGIYGEIMVKILENGWMKDKRLRRGTWDKLSQVLVWDYLDERLCPKCNGAGIRIDQRPCNSCEDGRIKRQNADIIELAQLTPKEWKIVEKRYQLLFRTLSGWEMSGLAEAKRKLYGD